MADSGANVQAAFLDAVKERSLGTAVEILKGIHDGKEALNRVARAVDPAQPGRGSALAPLVPRLDDVRRVGDLLFDVARLHVDTLDKIFGLRGKHTSRLEERIGDLLGFPLRGNQGEVLEMVVPVRAVEADRLERPTDGEATRYCEIHRQFRAKNLTSAAWPAGDAVAPVTVRWSREPGVELTAVRVDVLREAVAVKPGEVLPLRLRVRWSEKALDGLHPAAEASGQYVLRGADGAVAKLIEVALRFDLRDERPAR
ncbi:MAG: hypothetical protein JWM10_4921 [Myxococcaceae bacterium]|nr:hypothetical protein [Myxococcaceae bacterium]